MATQGPLFPSTVVNDSGIGTTAWTNPGNITTSNNVYATVARNTNSDSNYLKATNFGFSIPSGATINGILVEWEYQTAATLGQVTDKAARIVKGGVIGSTDKSTAGVWSNIEVFNAYGSSSDLWGTTWTSDDINSSTFGAALAVTVVGSAGNANVDSVRITVTYTPAGPTGPIIMAQL